MKKLIDGFRKFREQAFPARAEMALPPAHGLAPVKRFVTGSGSGIVAEVLNYCEPGKRLVIRNARNIVPCFGPQAGAT